MIKSKYVLRNISENMYYAVVDSVLSLLCFAILSHIKDVDFMEMEQ